MLLEAVNKPVRFRFSDGMEVRLVPGKPIELQDDRAKRLLAITPERVRVVHRGASEDTRHGWLAAWRQLAALTYGIRRDDLRLQGVMLALAACDEAYLRNDWQAFRLAAQRVKNIVEATT